MAYGISFAQGPPVQRVRVLGDVMVQQVLTRVAPAYPALAKQKGISGEVELYAAVGRDGAVEQVAPVRGPSALQSAAADAVKQWRFRPYLVNGQPVEVDTTVWVDFLPSAAVGSAVGVQPAVGRYAARPGGIDWEDDRRLSGGAPISDSEVAATMPAATATRTPATAVTPAVATVRPPAGSGTRLSSGATAVAAPVTDAGIPQVGVPSPGNGIPLITSLPPGTPNYTAVKPSTVVPASQPYVPPVTSPTVPPLLRPIASVSQPMTGAPEAGVGVVTSEGPAGLTEWRLIRKVPPVYPAAAVTAGIEGVVVVNGTVEKDGTLHNLRAMSGPPQLQQAAVDAAAQYIYEPVLRGNRLSEAQTQVAVDFLLTGAAVVAPEVMAGRLMSSFTPAYPAEALRAGVSGYVTLHALIGREGQVKTVTVVSGPELLRAAALDAVKQWKWLPFKRNGVDVDVETDVMVHFSIPPV
jgi:TonB family protein